MEIFLKNKTLIFILSLGLSIRLFLSITPGFKFDMDAWVSWAIRLNEVGFANFYSDEIWTNYTPGFLYILYSLGKATNLFQLTYSTLYVVIKFVSIFAEILMASFIYMKLSKLSIKWATLAATIILLNPAFIFNSSIWGQIDGLLSLLMLLTIYFLAQKKLISSSISFGLSLLVKPQAIALLPIFGLYLLKHPSIKNFLQMIIPATLSIFALSLPFFPNQSLLGLSRLLAKMVSDYSYTSLFAYNLWGVVGFWINDSILWNTFSYQQLGYLIYALYWILIAYLYLKGRLSLYSLAALAALSFFFLPTRVHERYLYPAIIFLIFLSAILKSRLILIFTLLLSSIHFLNLYYVYIYYNEIYLKLPKVLYNPILYNILDNTGKLLSVVSTIIFLIITFVIIKFSYASKKIKL